MCDYSWVYSLGISSFLFGVSAGIFVGIAIFCGIGLFKKK